MSQPRTPRTIHDDFETIERYVAATFACYERTLVALIPTLEEPRIADSDLALKRLRFLVETLVGFAVGAAVGAVAREARRGFTEEVRSRVALLLGRIVRDGSTAVAVSEFTPPARFLCGQGQPLLDTLGSRLLVRLCHSIPETSMHVSAIHAEITRAVPVRLPEFSAALDRLAADDAPALAFSDQLASGWQHYASSVSKHGLARPPEMKENEPWRAWTRRLGGRAVPDPPARDELVARGVLLRIA